MKLTKEETQQLRSLFLKQFGSSLSHAALRFNHWTMAVWNDDDISEIISKPRNVNQHLDKLWAEIAQAERPHTTIAPQSVSFGHPALKAPITFEKKLENLLLNGGMNDMAENRTGDSSKSNTHMAVGDDNTAELITNIALGNELDIKEFDTDGDRETVNQTERYAMAFFRSDFGMDVTLKEAALVTAAAAGVYVARVTFADKAIGAGQTMTAQISVTHRNGTT